MIIVLVRMVMMMFLMLNKVAFNDNLKNLDGTITLILIVESDTWFTFKTYEKHHDNEK